MKKTLKTFLLFIAFILLASSLISCRSLKEQFVPETEEFEISIADEINVYLGQSYKLSPNLTDKDGNTVESRFTFTSSSSKVSITSAGEILINEIPTEDILVTIHEKNTKTEKTVKLNVITSLTEVYGVLNGEGALPIGEQTAIYNNLVAFDVVTKPRALDIEDYCEVKVRSDSGEETNAFLISYDGSKIYLRAVGLGEGKIILTFKDGEKLFNTTEIDFKIKMSEGALSDAILKNENKTLLSSEDIAKITTLVIDNSVTDISECQKFAALDTVVLNSDALTPLVGATDKYCYRVKGAILGAYLLDSAWSGLFSNIIPYETSYTERAVVYRSSRSIALSYEIVDDDFELATLVFAGYVNSAWKNGAGDTVTAGDIALIEKNGIHLFAEWTPNINKVIFNANGGIGDMAPQEIATDATERLKPSVFAKKGYSLQGWSTTPDGEAVYEDQASYTMGAGESYTLYAVWVSNSNTLEFSANGGTGNMDSISLTTDSSVMLPLVSFSRAGYTFCGWSTSSDGEVVYEDQASYTMGTNSKYTLYAVWEPLVNKLTLDSNNGTGDTLVLDEPTDREFDLPTNGFVLKGYTFLGWSKAPNGTVLYTDGELYRMTADSEVVLYAIWEASLNSIIFDANGGEGTMAPEMLRTGESAPLYDCLYERSGYTFIGWSTTKTGSAEYENTANYVMGTESEYILYAVWMPNENALAFSANGGSGEMGSITLLTDESTVLPANTFVRVGYDFLGWSTSPTGTVEYGDTESYTMGGSASAVLYAVWQARINTLILNANNDGDKSDQQIISKGTDEVFDLPKNTFAIPGYTFLGWSYKYDGSVNFTDEASYKMSHEESVTLYAVWQANSNEIIFSANIDGVVGTMQNQIIKTDATAKLNKCRFKKDGYTFLGWSTTADGEVELADGEEYLMTSAPSRTLYAIWSKDSYTIRYVLSGGINSNDAVYAYDVESDTITLGIPARAGYTFVGWYTEPEMVTAIQAIERGTFGDIVLYAKWIVNTNKLYLDPNGGEGAVDPIEMVTDSAQYIPAVNTIFYKNGYTFVGWSKTPTGEVVYSDNASYTMGTDAEYTLYAIWKRDTYTITYELDRGINASNPTSYHVESDTIELLEPTKSGFTFLGWYTDPSMTSGRITAIESGSHGNLVLYAKWSANTYTVTFNPNGGEGTMASQTMKSGEIQNLSENLFFRNDTHPTFLGWALTPNGRLVYTNGEAFRMEAADITLYALWSSNEYAITYVLDGGINSIENVSSYNSGNDEIPLYAPTKVGSEFVGWYTNSAFTNKIDCIPENAEPQLTLYAKWDPIEYIITAGDKQYVRHYGDEYNIPALTMKGYNFDGWFYNGALISESTQMLITSDHELESSWSIRSYSISYSMGDWQKVGESYPESFTVDSVLTLSSPTYKYYPEYNEFDGWYLDSEFTVPFDAEALLEDPFDITLYPKSKKPITAIYTSVESTPDLSAKRVIIDWSGVTTLDLSSYSRAGSTGCLNNNIIEIYNTVEEVIFIGNSSKIFENLSLNVRDFASGQILNISFIDFNFHSMVDGALKPTSGECDAILNINVEGKVEIATVAASGSVIGKSDAKFTNDINFTGSGEINLTAGNGAEDSDGGVAIYAKYITLTSGVTVKAYGGAGGAGSEGDEGKDSSWWSATSGDDGNPGGKGGNAIVLSGVIDDRLLGYSNLTAKGGAGGVGGVGGEGGRNKGWFSTGASGGDGGAGGAGGIGMIDSLGTKAYQAGAGGNGGNGGDGGKGLSKYGSDGDGGNGGVNGYGTTHESNTHSGQTGGKGTSGT
ncbi:MAG: InlB B-repeat-containing protein [Clostridia bacterium]|nr:InlB B-repeat-containing protein [Clostridia bacterium]